MSYNTKRENLPPTSNALHQHLPGRARDTIRDTRANQAHPNLPQVEQCEWKLNNTQTQLVQVLLTIEPMH